MKYKLIEDLPTCEGQTVMCGWEWYQPTTLNGRPISDANSSALSVALTSCSSDISTLSGFLSRRLNITDDTIETNVLLLLTWKTAYVNPVLTYHL